MKMVLAVWAAVLFACNLAAFGETEIACGQSLDTALRSRAVLEIDSRPAGLEIMGTDSLTLHLSCTASDDEVARETHIRFSGTPDDAHLTISGNSFHHGNLQIRVEVPRKTSLKVKMPVGQVKMEEVAGDKDIELMVGQIIISSAKLWDYRS